MKDPKHQSQNLEEIIHEIAEILPSQGPIDVFIHHNTLHAFEHLPFEEAVVEASKIYGAEAFLPERRYIEEYDRGRINERDLERAISSQELNAPEINGLSALRILKQFLLASPPVEGFQEVKWLLRERSSNLPSQTIEHIKLREWLDQTDLYNRVINSLGEINQESAYGLRDVLDAIPRDSSVTNHQATILWAAALLNAAENWREPEVSDQSDHDVILDEMINPILIRFCEEYLDLGFSAQLMPDRNSGMLDCFLKLTRQAHFGIPLWLTSIRQEIDRFSSAAQDPKKLLEELIDSEGVPAERRANYLTREALSLRGWAGYIALVEHRPDLLHGREDEIKPSLLEYLVIRVILRRCARRSTLFAARLKDRAQQDQQVTRLDSLYCFAYHLLLLFTSLNLGHLLLSPSTELAKLICWLSDFSQTKRRRLWHLAYENNLYQRTLEALKGSSSLSTSSAQKPIASFVFCIDDREESIRRHLEARNPGYATYGTAGFFGVDANYTMLSGSTAPYCPVIIKPTHSIREIPKKGLERDLKRYQRKQTTWFQLSGYLNRGTGTIAHNLLLSLAGCLSLIPMIIGVLAPSTQRWIEKLLGSAPTLPNELNELQIEQNDDQFDDSPGYTLLEMSDRVIAVLRGIGLIEHFGEIVIMIGHGSSSRNNPLRSAYDCGACGGRPGRVNARAFSLMANNPKVRALVLQRSGITIPETTVFIGAFHNTCSDQIEYFDLDRLPKTHSATFAKIKADIAQASKLNAFERCRRFVQAGISDVDRAAEEAIARSYMLSEARPEYGHATNAICIVGPRRVSRELFLDRRAFLVSYDHSIDSDSSILTGILRAVVPVCGGINLEYLFSAMDNEVYGAGTKLPHNIVSLVGVMNGTSSDLRTGLPSQMVEIHEPVRLLLVIVSTREQLERVIQNEPSIAKVFAGGWIKVALLEPSGEIMWRGSNGEYSPFEPFERELAVMPSYRDWFIGHAEHLPFARIPQQGA